jgi:hypothetical protein
LEARLNTYTTAAYKAGILPLSAPGILDSLSSCRSLQAGPLVPENPGQPIGQPGPDRLINPAFKAGAAVFNRLQIVAHILCNEGETAVAFGPQEVRQRRKIPLRRDLTIASTGKQQHRTGKSSEGLYWIEL